MFKPGTVMYARAASKINRRNCDSCGAELTAQQGLSSGICDKPECHDWMIEKVGTELIERKRRENAERLDRMFTKMAPAVEVAASSIDATPDTVIRSKIPFQGKPVVPLPEERRAAFEKHIRWVVARAFTEEVSEVDLSYREQIDRDEPDVLETACSACQGGCCELGGTSGFLQVVDVDRWRQQQPDVTADEIIDYYLAMVPAETTEGACVYQSAKGCALPREKRNDQCNTFHCKALKTLQDKLIESETGKVVMIADEDGEARKIVAWSPATGRVPLEARAPQPAEPEEPQPITFSSEDFQ